MCGRDPADPPVLLAGVAQMPAERVKAVADRRRQTATVQHPGDHHARLAQAMSEQLELVGEHQQRALVPAAEVADRPSCHRPCRVDLQRHEHLVVLGAVSLPGEQLEVGHELERRLAHVGVGPLGLVQVLGQLV